jgi:hypothetical protein
MSRTTLVIPPALRRRAAAHARGQGKSLSQFVRERLEESLAAVPGTQRSRARARFLGRKPWQGKAGGATDTAVNHDFYLYGLPKRDRAK